MLLEKWSRGEAITASDTITRRPPGCPQRLSFPQQRQLFLELLEPGTAVNNLSICLELVGALRVSVLTESANRVLDRHEASRTRFVMDRGIPFPEQASSVQVTLPVVDLQNFPESERIHNALGRARTEALTPFDLTRAPLLRIRIYRLAPERHILFVLVHHSIGDGWSLGVFLRDLSAFYESIIVGAQAHLPDLPIQYSDYAHWQRKLTDSDHFETALSYWKKRLSGAPPLLELPVDHARGARQTFAGATHHLMLNSELTSALKEFSRKADVSLFMTLLAAFHVLLYRYSGQEDVSVGTPIAGRSRPEVQHLIGVFINTLVIRIEMDGDRSFLELLRSVRDVALGAYAHQDLPFEALVAEVNPKRDLSRTPLFQVMFNLQSPIMPNLELPGLSVRPLPFESGTSQFDLTFIMAEQDGSLVGSVEYNSDLFEPGTIARMAASFSLLLEDAVDDPNKPLSRMRVLSETEERRLVAALNHTARDYPRNKCVHELIEAQVERTPDEVAVIYEETRLTYRELDLRANNLAAHFRQLGVGPGVPVGIYMHRSADLLTSLLGTLKAGGAYVPLNPDDPARRVAFVLADAGAKVLLAESGVDLPEGHDCRVVHLGDHGSTGQSTENGSPGQFTGERGSGSARATPESTAYIIYTSGSTGRPKGVVVSHRSLVNFLWSMARRPGLRQGDALLAVTSPSFDIAALELFLPLIVGGTVVVASQSTVRDPLRLAESMVEHGVGVMQATPATWRMMVDSGWPGRPGLKALCGGEALSPELADSLLERVGSLWNLYGPTETTVWSAVKRVRNRSDVATVGDPIANTQLYVLDDQFHPVPPGVKGELYIGGDGLARGYVNDAALTATKFLPSPFLAGVADGARLYKTGDGARYLPDGQIELLGRLDNQVKIQGFRIELGEVESTLIEHPLVRQAVVTARAEKPGDLRLVAYFVPDRQAAPRTDDLRAFMTDTLPAYMVPGAFVSLDEFPLTSNGKIDRGALPAPDGARPVLGKDFVAPRDELEKSLAQIYESVLGIDRIGIHDNFFDIGGGSIQILEIILHAQSARLTLSPEMFFEFQTVAELAAMIHGNAVESPEIQEECLPTQ